MTQSGAPKTMRADATTRGRAAVNTSSAAIPRCGQKGLPWGIRYAARKPSIRLIITPDAAQMDKSHCRDQKADGALATLSEVVSNDFFRARRNNAKYNFRQTFGTPPARLPEPEWRLAWSGQGKTTAALSTRRLSQSPGCCPCSRTPASAGAAVRYFRIRLYSSIAS